MTTTTWPLVKPSRAGSDDILAKRGWQPSGVPTAECARRSDAGTPRLGRSPTAAGAASCPPSCRSGEGPKSSLRCMAASGIPSRQPTPVDTVAVSTVSVRSGKGIGRVVLPGCVEAANSYGGQPSGIRFERLLRVDDFTAPAGLYVRSPGKRSIGFHRIPFPYEDR